MDKKKIYCFTIGQQGNIWVVYALCEDGRLIAGHACSDPRFFEGDIGLTSTSKHEAYDAACGKDNWSLKWVDDPVHDEEVQAAIKENQRLFPQSKTTAEQPAMQQPKAHEATDITVAELTQFINAQCVAASRDNQPDQANILAHLGGQIDYALSLYRQHKG